jgi:hypothetical protein
LRRRFGEGRVFLDVDNIPPGAQFRNEIRKVLSECAVVLVVIGNYWADELSKRGQRNEGDYVLLEIESAISVGATLIPVLVGGAQLPEVSMLPESIRKLLDFQAARIEPGSFDSNVRALVRLVENVLNEKSWWAFW